MSSSTYNANHWQKKIAGYQTEAWSNKPSPFAKLVKTYIGSKPRILELGTGAGQDGTWFSNQGYDVTASDGDSNAFDSIRANSNGKLTLEKFDLLGRFPFDSEAFDVVYAQLVLHYFEDAEMIVIMKEIQRILAKDGIVAVMVNTVEDPEYKESGCSDGFIRTDKLTKRFFSKSTLAPFVADFKTLLFDAKGNTPKDDEVGNSGMIQFIGRKQ
jgi:SAM-dependent methyltransferase